MLRRLLSLSLACLLAACASFTAPDESSALKVPTDHASAERLIVEARSYLDRWNGEDEILEEAVRRIELVTTHFPDHAPARVAAARAILDGGIAPCDSFAGDTLEAAAAELLQALALDPDESDAHVYLVLVRLRQKEIGLANEHLSAAIKAGSKHPWLEEYRAQFLDAVGHHEGAVEVREQIVSTSKDVRVIQRSRYELARHFVRTGDFNRAESELQAVIATDPQRAWSHGNYASFLLFDRGDAARALESYTRATELRPDVGLEFQTELARYVNWADAVLAGDALGAERLSVGLDFEPEGLQPYAIEVANWESLLPRLPAFLARGADINDAGARGMLPLVVAAQKSTPAHVAALMKIGAQVDATDRDGDAALEVAAARGDSSVVQVLIEGGADVNRVRSDGSLVLNRLISLRADEGVEILLKAGADPNRSSLKAETPLILVVWTAAPVRAQRLTKLLLAHGADPRIKHPMLGKDAIVMARERQLTEVVAMMEAQVKKLGKAAR